MRVVTGSHRGGSLSRFVGLMLVLFAIVLVAVWFAVRSEGGRGIIESHLAKRLGQSVSVGTTRIGWPYVLVLEHVRTPGVEAAGTPGFSVAEIRVGCGIRSWRPRWNVRLRQLIARVQDAEDGTVTPACMARLGALRTASMQEVVRVTEGLRAEQVRVHVNDSKLGWLDENGEEIAAVRDVEFRMIPVNIEKRELYYFALDIRSVTGLALAEGRDLHWEWLTTRELAVIELSKAGALIEPREAAPMHEAVEVPVEVPDEISVEPVIEGVG